MYIRSETIESPWMNIEEEEKLFEPAEKWLAMSDSNMLEKFGMLKTIMIYKHVKKFYEKIKKWLKNYKTKKMVV